MTNKEHNYKAEDYKPLAVCADNVTAPCQKGIRLYPARLALTDKAFEKIKTTGTAPVLPKGIPTSGDDYDLRRLRNGYIYILADNAESNDFPITAKAENGQAWYIYGYSNHSSKRGSFFKKSSTDFELYVKKETEGKEQEAEGKDQEAEGKDQKTEGKEQEISSLDTSQHNTENNNNSAENNETNNVTNGQQIVDIVDIGQVHVQGKGHRRTDYIELNPAISTAYIMYSDFELPYSLLQEIEKSSSTRSLWMRKINIQAPSDATADIQQLTEVVADFSPKSGDIKDYKSNCYRFAAIGKLEDSSDLAKRINNGKGVIVALEDPIGTARDLSGYHLYLATLRENTLGKYEYAISTARIIDSYVVYKYKEKEKENRKRAKYYKQKEKAGWGYSNYAIDFTSKPIKFKPFYYDTLADYIKTDHLTDNGNTDILNILKTELHLEDSLPGVNTINKLAYLPSRFGRTFKNLVTVHCHFISEHKEKLTKLHNLYGENEKDYSAANAWCCYMHGFLHGLDISSYGRNALIKALPIPDAPAYKEPPYTQQAPSAVEFLKKYLSDFVKALGTLEKVAKMRHFDIVIYDLVVEIVTDKVYQRYINKRTKYRKVPETILKTYEVALSSKNITLKETSAPRHAPPRKFKLLEERTEAISENITSIQINGGSYGLFKVTETLAGANKMLASTVLLGFFVENKAETVEGQLANDPALASLQTIAGLYAPQGKLEGHVADALKELEELSAQKNLLHSNWINYFEVKGVTENLTLIKNTVINANTALAGVGAMFDYFNWLEADYKSDEIGKTAALLSMSGGLAVEAALGGLGLLASSSLSAGTIALLTGLSYATLGIGIVLISIAIIYNYFAPEDIELWMQNGFWGKSPLYWGEPNQEKAYEWKSPRLSNFVKQFEDSKFTYVQGNLNETDKVRYYYIEMQRYIKSAAEIVITLDTANPRKILVHYPGIYTEQDAQSIKIKEMIGYKKSKRSIYDQSNNEFNFILNKLNVVNKFEKNGVASLTITNESLSYMNYTNHSGSIDLDADRGTIPYEDLHSIEVGVNIPNYRGNKRRKNSKGTTKLILKKN